MPTKSILFIDSHVANYRSLLDSQSEPAEVFVLNAESDGLTQIAAYLQNRSGIDAIHVISHGSQGALYLGSTMLNSGNLSLYQSQLAAIGGSLTETGDILLYGCNVAQGSVGMQFIDSLARYTQADVAASDDATGADALGGNWSLETRKGTIDTIPMRNSDYRYILPGDTTAPTLTSLTFPATINLSSGNQSVSFAAHAEDSGSGVESVIVWFDKPLTTNIGSFALWSIRSGWTDSTPSDASDSRTVQSYNNPGIYNVTSVDVQDLAGNSRSYTKAQLSSLGIATSINVTDGVFIPNALTVTPLMEQGSIILSLSAAQWSASSNSFSFAISYDSSIVHFDSWRAGSSGAYSVSTSIAEVGAKGMASIFSNISNGGDSSDFIQLVFSTTAQSGNFVYSLSSETLNDQNLANVSGNYIFKVADTTAPAVNSFIPTVGALGVAVGSNIVVSFSEAIAKGAGAITLKTADGVTVATYDASASANLSISGNTLTVNPSADLSYGTGYRVEFAVGTIKDLAGNSYAGSTNYNFNTLADPASQTFAGNGSNESFTGGTGNDTIDGAGGTDTSIYFGKITDYFIKYNRALGTVTITDHRTSGDGTDSLKSIEKLQFADKTFDLLNPARTESAAFGKSQSFLFDPAYYLLKHPDLVPTVTLTTAFDSYKTTASQGAAPNAWFDPVYYANKWADLKALNLDAVTLFAHYNLYGVWEGRSAGPTFDKYDGTRYLKDNPDVAAYVDAYVADFLGSRSNGAIAHYVIYGAAEGRVAYDTAGVAIEQAILIGVPG